MMISNRKAKSLTLYRYLAVFIAFLSISISACNSNGTSFPVEGATEINPATNQVIPAETVPPTPTPTPGQVVLIAPEGSYPEQVAALQVSIGELASLSGLSFQTLNELSQVDFSQNIRIAVVLPPDTGLATVAASNPGTQFLGIGIPGLPAAENLSVIGAEGERPDQQGFTAGYLAAMISEDWRMGVISQSGDAAGRAARNGFTNGAIFYCGLCRPVYPPFIQYPQYVEYTSSASEGERQSVIDTLNKNAVKTVYVSPTISDDELLLAVALAGLNIIGGITPSEEVKSHWVATIQMDPTSAIEEIWPFLLNGEGGKILPMPYIITNANELLLSQGRQAQVEKLLSELINGFIDTGVDPMTGEFK